jgi:hypothetical protein
LFSEADESQSGCQRTACRLCVSFYCMNFVCAVVVPV